MKERPILFSAPMVRAIIAGSKTQTRRVLAFPPSVVARGPRLDRVFYTRGSGQYPGGDPEYTGDQPPGVLVSCLDHTCQRVRCPFGVEGDQLWVREAWARVEPSPEIGERLDLPQVDPRADLDLLAYWRRRIVYRADLPATSAPEPYPSTSKWRPSIHMPRWASRITLEVTGVRVERLQDISEADAQAEGAGPLWLQAGEPGCWWTMNEAAGTGLHARTAAGAFRKGWDTINGKRAPWASNPWCWCVSFRRVHP